PFRRSRGYIGFVGLRIAGKRDRGTHYRGCSYLHEVHTEACAPPLTTRPGSNCDAIRREALKARASLNCMFGFVTSGARFPSKDAHPPSAPQRRSRFKTCRCRRNEASRVAKSGRGLPHSKTFGNSCGSICREASWSAAVLCRFPCRANAGG